MKVARNKKNYRYVLDVSTNIQILNNIVHKTIQIETQIQKNPKER